MATESLLLTALPNGFRQGGELLGVTVFVSPRLSTDGEPFLPLTKFPAFTDWPAALAQLKLFVEVENLGTFDTGADPDSFAQPDSATWALVFGGDVGVITGNDKFKDLSEKKIRSFPAAEVADYVLDLYTDVAEGYPLKFPPVTFGPLAPLADELGHLGDGRADHYKRLDSLFEHEQSQLVEGRHGRYIPRGLVPAAEQRRFAFTQAYRFYDRFRNGQSIREPWGDIDPAKVPPPPKRPEYDFHGYVAALGDYPLLLRPLGLAIDLIMKRDPQMQDEGRVRVRVDGPGDLAWTMEEVARPWTNYELRDRRFIPRPRDREGELVDGTLRLESTRHFRVHQIDVDGSALKTVDFLGNVKRVKDHLQSVPRSMTPDESSLPALRGVGFTISRNDRAEQMVNRLDNAVLHDKDVTNKDPADLFAEDVTRGYRIDVGPNGKPFLSLCLRTGTYVVRTPGGDQPIPLPADEGFLKGSSTTSVPGDDEELYLHEAVGSWGGWSLVAKRPGRRVMPDESVDDGSQPDVPDAGVPLVTEFHAMRGTLPRLRYGSEYRMRARAVDLAGNSVGEEGLDPQHVSAPETFFRWEPVPSPAVIPRLPYTEGESLMRMVVRSTLDVTTDAYVALPRVVNLPGHSGLLAYRIENERWIAPPKTSQQMAEFHGVFDPAIGTSQSQGAVDTAFDLAARESGTFMQPVPGAVVVNPSGATPTDLTTHPVGDALHPGEYVRIDTDDLQTPYLPDVASRGVAFTSLPNDDAVNTPTRTITWPGGTDWYDRQPLRVRIEDGPAPAPVVPAGAVVAADWNAGARLLTVFVPQAEIVTVRLSSFVDKDPVTGADDLRVMGIWNRLSAAAQLAQDGDARHGRAWMLTPPETLVLVHAVEKPLLAPVVDVTDSGMQRILADTFCAFAGSIDNHAKSTGRLDVDAVWNEQRDDIGKDLPDDGVDGRPLAPGLAHVGDFQLDSDEDDCKVGYNDVPRVATKPPVHQLRHEFGDTKHRRVRYHATATTRFREYFPPEIIEGRDENGDRFILHGGPEKELIVPSSRRPEPPDVLYIVPTFTWEEETLSGLLSQQFLATTTGVRRRARAGGTAIGGVSTRIPRTFRRTRRGGGLRVYLRRGWFSSGDGEQLGVVLKDQPWLTWPVDITAGMEVSALARLNADRVATRLFDRGAVKPKGRASLTPTERLVNALQPSSRSKAATRSRDVPAQLQAAEQFASIAHVIDEGMFGIFELLDPGIDPDKLITQWGADPIWGSMLPSSGPYIHQFPLRTTVGTGLSLAETTRALVTVVGHTPQFDVARGLWYCDLQVNAGLSYFPFVRLGLCRYQPHSIANAHISRVVRADYAQLIADRSCSLTKSGSTAHVSVRGPAGYGDIAKNMAGADPAGPIAMNASRRVTAQVERLAEGADPDLGWRPVGDEIFLEVGTAQGLGDIRWTADVPVPTKPSGAQQRIAVCEFEVLETDESEKDATIMTGFFDFRPVRFRMVYADHLAL